MAIGRIERSGGLRVPGEQQLMHGCRSLLLEPVSPMCALVLGNDGHVRQTVGKGTKIQSGPTAKHDWLVRWHDGQCRAHIVQPFAGRIVLCRVDMAEKVVRCSLAFCRVGSRCQNVENVIDLHRIGINNDAAGLPGQFDCHARLAARGWPGYQGDTALHGLCASSSNAGLNWSCPAPLH